ncbi:MAG: translation initiation factor IF-2 N-terminal domain-containing protein, partial [Candidatus Izemoplasmatales bacterium]|nr:translation initiation factor IF-2 N-terminal domain-containing protein [Candidatus Izemoplasmatales bacterium]
MSKYIAKKKFNKNREDYIEKENNLINKKKKSLRPTKTTVIYKQGMTVLELAEEMDKPVTEIIKKLMFLRVMATQNQEISRENAELLAMEYNLEFKDEVITDVTRFDEMEDFDKPEDLVNRPPVVTIMGHVDHG